MIKVLCERCYKRLEIDRGWTPPPGIDPRMRKLVCPLHPGICIFTIISVNQVEAEIEAETSAGQA
jgi:hypothetical protein